MSRTDWQRIYDAKRTGLRNRLRDERRVPQEKADALIEEWVTEAAARGLSPEDPRYRSEAWEWLAWPRHEKAPPSALGVSDERRDPEK
jgi:hypothetical protein